MGLLPPILVAGCFVVAVVTALGIMAYLAWRGSKQSDFFTECISERYDIKLPIALINSYEQLKAKLQDQHEGADDEDESAWVRQLSREDKEALREALFKRLTKTIDVLDRVSRDKPGNWKLWREKLVSERFYTSLCDGEREIRDQMEACLAEAKELAPGIDPSWENPDMFFQQAVYRWRNGQREEREKKDQKKADQQVKKEKEKEARREEVAKREEEEKKLKEERDAQKAMEKLLREEESMGKKDKGKAKEKPVAKAKGAKKK